MRDKIYFNLLILCGIWFHGIIGETFADEEIKESSNSFVRHKRVVSHVPDEDIIMQIKQAPHVVIIRHHMVIHCVGSIISHYIVIAAAACVQLSPDQYKIISGTSRSFGRGSHYDVVNIRQHLGIALLTTGEPFVYGAYCRNIQLHVSLLLPGTVGQVSGWGFNKSCLPRGTVHPFNLRSIEVPIMAHRDCVNKYQPHNITITDKEVCTYHPQRHCGHTDFGAGLVVNGYLAGVFLWSGLNQNSTDPQYPDVFALLQHSDYSYWIRSNMQDIEAHQIDRAY